MHRSQVRRNQEQTKCVVEGMLDPLPFLFSPVDEDIVGGEVPNVDEGDDANLNVMSI